MLCKWLSDMTGSLFLKIGYWSKGTYINHGKWLVDRLTILLSPGWRYYWMMKNFMDIVICLHLNKYLNYYPLYYLLGCLQCICNYSFHTLIQQTWHGIRIYLVLCLFPSIIVLLSLSLMISGLVTLYHTLGLLTQILVHHKILQIKV